MNVKHLVVILYVVVAVAMIGSVTSAVERSNQISQQKEIILQKQEATHRQVEAMKAQWNAMQP